MPISKLVILRVCMHARTLRAVQDRQENAFRCQPVLVCDL